jgi:hypothetical protein
VWHAAREMKIPDKRQASLVAENPPQLSLSSVHMV